MKILTIAVLIRIDFLKGWPGLAWSVLAWAGLGWPGLDWAGLGWAGLDLAGPHFAEREVDILESGRSTLAVFSYVLRITRPN